MTTIDHEGRPRLELVQSVPADETAAERLDQAPAAESPGKELVPVDQAGELVERAPVEPPAVIEGRVIDGPRPAAIRPILPTWLRDWPTFRAAVVWMAGRSAHLLGFHGLRLPLYWLKLVGRSPVGLGRALAWWSRWVSDSPARAVRENLASGPGITPDAFYRVTEQHLDQVRGRLAVSAAAVVTLAVGVFGSSPRRLAGQSGSGSCSGSSCSGCWAAPPTRRSSPARPTPIRYRD